MNSLVDPSRIELARSRAGFTKTDLSRQLGVSPRKLHRVISGDDDVDQAMLGKLAEIFELKETFFEARNPVKIPRGVTFRARKSLTARDAGRGVAAGTFGTMIADWVAKEMPHVLKPVAVPDLSGMVPEAAAKEVRRFLNISPVSQPNTIHALEDLGVRVFRLSEDTDFLNAYAFFSGSTPYAFLNRNKSAEASRFDAAHELGHLVLHRDNMESNRQTEMEANQFASAFLMPLEQVIAKRVAPMLSHLQERKATWGVSVAALVRRYLDVGFIDQNRYRFLCVEMARKGWLRSEPNPIEFETSRVWTEVRRELWEQQASVATIATDLGLPEHEVVMLMNFGVERQQVSLNDETVLHFRRYR